MRFNDTMLPDEYWDGINFVDSVSLLQPYDIKIEINAFKSFTDSNILSAVFNVTGYLYYQTQSLRNKVSQIII